MVLAAASAGLVVSATSLSPGAAMAKSKIERIGNLSESSSTEPGLTWTQSASMTGGTLMGSGLGDFTFETSKLKYLGTVPVDFQLSWIVPSGNPASPGVVGSTPVVVQQSTARVNFDITYAGTAPLHTHTTIIHPGDPILEGSFPGSVLSGSLDSNYFRVHPPVTNTDVQEVEMFGAHAQYDHKGYLYAGPGGGAGFIAYHTGALVSLTPGQSVQTFSMALNTMGFDGSTVLPEPGAWVMLLAGFGGLGAALRRSRGRAPARA
jgi:hypothetical protein